MHLLLFGVQGGADLCSFVFRFFIPHAAVRAENVFLCKQLAMFVERGARPRRAKDREKLALVLLARLFDWKNALVVVSPRTFLSWKSAIEKSWWRWVCPRPVIPLALRQVIRRIARENPQWSCGQIARVVALQLGAAVDPKTVRKYLPISDPRRSPHRPCPIATPSPRSRPSSRSPSSVACITSTDSKSAPRSDSVKLRIPDR